jgi:hypothetical protein
LPPVYGTLLLTPFAAAPAISVPAEVAELQFNVAIVPVSVTDLLSVHVLPPTLSAKLAAPPVEGVPEMVYIKLPDEFVNIPGASVAVKPVTPVDATICPG